MVTRLRSTVPRPVAAAAPGSVRLPRDAARLERHAWEARALAAARGDYAMAEFWYTQARALAARAGPSAPDTAPRAGGG